MTPYELGQVDALIKLGMRGVAGRIIEESPQMIESMLGREIPAVLSRSASEAGKDVGKKLTQKQLSSMKFMPGLHGM